MDQHRQSVDIQDDHQEVLNGEEDEHLVNDVEVAHHREPDHQERPILDEQGFHRAPDVRPEVGEPGGSSFRVVLGRQVHYCWDISSN